MKVRRVRLLQDLVYSMAEANPQLPALLYKKETLSYKQLAGEVERFAHSICGLGLGLDERVAIYLPKQLEVVVGIFGAAAAGGVAVPINPMLKAQQVSHILRDCNVRVLITSPSRAKQLQEILPDCHDLNFLVLTGPAKEPPQVDGTRTLSWDELLSTPAVKPPGRIDSDMAAILYTSGSTGSPKGVVLSHLNMVAAAESSADFLQLTERDRLLAVLPLSFDYGLTQLTTAYYVGASVVLMDYLLAKEVVAAVVKYGITGISAVPPIWNQLAVLDWPDDARKSMRYITTSGGAARRSTLDRLRSKLPDTVIFQMYGLTEAFRSSFLPPDEIDERPGSVGKALPNVELMIVREDGTRCAPDEPGELVHRGSLVARGYWNDPERTALRFRPAPGQPAGIPLPEIAVWSGDQMRMDADGYLYFESRRDEMIKTSGYRVSPTEVEEIIFASGLAAETVALGVAHPELGQAIILLVDPANEEVDVEAVLNVCRKEMPSYMVPEYIELRSDLPKNPNGKIDRAQMTAQYKAHFSEAKSPG
ncbi:MAG: acyl-CoA ligase (AMP-forming), exosortase A system-associated [Halioglobus sp.]|nr:acyl-CoA ligase (AMP-forming), exosortase A system-associated [Halioglobus sp.]